jgi:hypothetical protein
MFRRPCIPRPAIFKSHGRFWSQKTPAMGDNPAPSSLLHVPVATPKKKKKNARQGKDPSAASNFCRPTTGESAFAAAPRTRPPARPPSPAVLTTNHDPCET